MSHHSTSAVSTPVPAFGVGMFAPLSSSGSMAVLALPTKFASLTHFPRPHTACLPVTLCLQLAETLEPPLLATMANSAALLAHPEAGILRNAKTASGSLFTTAQLVMSAATLLPTANHSANLPLALVALALALASVSPVPTNAPTILLKEDGDGKSVT